MDSFISWKASIRFSRHPWDSSARTPHREWVDAYCHEPRRRGLTPKARAPVLREAHLGDCPQPTDAPPGLRASALCFDPFVCPIFPGGVFCPRLSTLGCPCQEHMLWCSILPCVCPFGGHSIKTCLSGSYKCLPFLWSLSQSAFQYWWVSLWSDRPSTSIWRPWRQLYLEKESTWYGLSLRLWGQVQEPVGLAHWCTTGQGVALIESSSSVSGGLVVLADIPGSGERQ